MSQKSVLRHQVYARQAGPAWHPGLQPFGGDLRFQATSSLLDRRTFYGASSEPHRRRWTILSRRPDPIVSAVSQDHGQGGFRRLAICIESIRQLTAPRQVSEPPAWIRRQLSPFVDRLSTVAKTSAGSPPLVFHLPGLSARSGVEIQREVRNALRPA